jgi:Matrixin
MRRKTLSFILIVCLVLANAASVPAGGALETIDITGNVPSPTPGLLTARVIGYKWDTRCIPVQYSMNNTLDPIPNPLGTPFLSVADAQATFQAAFDAWNRIPTSFIDMRITGTTDNPGFAGFDFVNELTFRAPATFGAIAASPSVALIADSEFAEGDDIDGDGDSDVSSAIKVATDADNDGDIEFPAGLYEAGTILDNDGIYNANTPGGLRFTIDDAAVDVTTNSVDLLTIAVHEFGHSHGLSHTLENQLDDDDGSGATMFPFIDTGDPAAELAQRTLSADDIAWSSYFYQEGTASSGPAAIRSGDIPFRLKYGLLKGELRHGVLNQPIAGGNVFAVKYLTDDVVASGFSGTTQLFFNPANGARLININNPAFHILNGNYVIPVPTGLYAVGAQPVDGSPVPAGSISLTAQIGSIFGQQNFNEEFHNGVLEDSREFKLSQRKPILAILGLTRSGIDIVTADSININNFGPRNARGFINPPPPAPPLQPGFLYAIQIPASQVTAINPGGEILIQGVAFDTDVFDASVVPVFAKAMLTTGVVNPNNTVSIDLANPLEVKNGFVGQDNDLAPFYFKNPWSLGRRVLNGIADGSIQNLFIVLQVPTTTPYPGANGHPPLVGLSVLQPTDITTPRLSFTSMNGGATWARRPDLNFRFSLVTSLPLE